MTRRQLVLGAVVLGLGSLLLGWSSLSRNLRAAELLWSLSQAHAGGSRALVLPDEVEVQNLTLPGREGPIRARIYRRKSSPPGKGLVVAHGVHYQGIDERRLMPFAAQLARAGLVVVTPELEQLSDYRITKDGVETIGAAVSWLAQRRDLVAEPRVGVLGFSFAGGLSLVVAADPRFKDRIAYVTSVGGHHDLERVLRFFARNAIETPAGVRREKAHDYGVVVLIYGEIERFVPEPDRELMRDALRAWLREEQDKAWAIASLCETPEAERLFERVASRRLHELGPDLERLIDDRRETLRALSPRGQLRAIRAPVYLLHGSADSVIPPSETEWANLELGTVEHQALVSPLLDHVEVSRAASLVNQLDLVGFMGRML